MDNDDELRRILRRKVSIERLLKKLDFAEEMVVQAAIDQPTLYRRATVYRVQKMEQRINAETNLDLIRSKIGLLKRDRIDKKDRTETLIKDMVTRTPRYLNAKEKFNRATVEEQFAKMLIDAFEQRMQAIWVVAKMAAVEISIDKRMKEKAEELGEAYEQIRRKYGD